MLNAISDTLEDTILQEVCASPYYAIIKDESTDLSTVKQLGVVVQYLSIETATLQCRFLKLLDMSQYVHATAENIVDCLTKYLDTTSPSPSSRKLAGASSDGASVMLGEENGVMVRLKAKVPGLIVTHCAAHRVASAACDAANAEPWFRKFDKSLNQVYTFFSHSSARTAELKEMQSLLDHPQLKLYRGQQDMCWLSLENAVTALRRCFKPVKAVLEHEGAEGEATAIGLSVQLGKPEYIITLHLLSDVLDILSSLSCVCQSVDLNLLGVETLVNDKIAALEKIREDVFMGGFMMDAQTDYPSEMSRINRATFKGKAESYLSTLIANLKRRFPHVHLLSLLGYLQPQNVASATPAYVMELAHEFGMSSAKLWNEFQSYQSFVSRLDPPTLQQAVMEMWHPTFRSTMVTAYSLISKLLARKIVLPASSVEAERVFSTMKQIKTPIHNRLTTITLDYLMRISMTGPGVEEWNSIPAALRWKAGGRRRITLTHTAASCFQVMNSHKGDSDTESSD